MRRTADLKKRVASAGQKSCSLYLFCSPAEKKSTCKPGIAMPGLHVDVKSIALAAQCLLSTDRERFARRIALYLWSITCYYSLISKCTFEYARMRKPSIWD